MYVALLAAALFIGVLLAVQTSVNLQLNGAVKTPYGASTLQLGVAAALLAILAVVAGAIGAVRLLPEAEWWHLLGGLASPLYITSGILLFPRLGALASVGLFVTGQMFASVGMDLFGLIGISRKPLTLGIVLGAIAVLAGITMIIRGQAAPKSAVATAPGKARSSIGAMSKPASATGGMTAVGWIVLGVVAGGVLPVQGAINAKLRVDISQPIAVATISFVVATLAIAVVLLVMLVLRRTPTPQLKPLRAMPWWGWLGGACAATYVTATFLLIPEIGAATTVALTVTGQQLASAAVDNFGLFRMPQRPLTSRRMIGLGLLVLGSTLVQLT